MKRPVVEALYIGKEENKSDEESSNMIFFSYSAFWKNCTENHIKLCGTIANFSS